MPKHTITAATGAEQKFTVSLFSSKGDAKPRTSCETWPQLIKRFSTPKIRAVKDGALFSPAKFSPAHRAKENARELSLLVLDYDHSTTIEEALRMWQPLGVKLLLYTTHSHQRITEDHPRAEDRFRVVIPLKEPISAIEYPRLFQWAIAISSGKCDTSCYYTSRLLYLS